MPRPNIVFFHVDQLNCFALGINGCRDVATPNMDRLFGRGVWFQRNVIANPWCMPSRTCWYTGLMSEEHGMLGNVPQFHLDPSVADIGPLVTSGGYDSVYLGKWHLDKPVQKSFQVEFGWHEHGEVGDAYTARAAEAFLANRQGGKPFFLNVGLLNPHDTCMWTDPFFPCSPGKFNLASTLIDRLPELPPNHYLSAHPTVAAGPVDPTQGRWTDLDWRYYMYRYYRNVEMVDAEVGRVIGALENSRWADNTLLIFASDHGEGLAQHYHYGKECILEHSVMAPLVVVHPGAKARRDVERMVSNIDVTATICDYAGVDPLPGRKGLSLRPLIEDRAVPDWRPYAASTTNRSRERIIRTRDHKLVNDRLNGKYILYDLVLDPWETRDAGADPAYAGTLARLKDLMDRNEASYHYAPQTIAMLKIWESGIDPGAAGIFN